jgi:hypothetical protein
MMPDKQEIELLAAVCAAVIGVLLVVRAMVMPATHRKREAERERLRKLKLEMHDKESSAGNDEDEDGDA